MAEVLPLLLVLLVLHLRVFVQFPRQVLQFLTTVFH